jgi:TonB family protein
VLVKDAEWKDGKARLRLEAIGTPVVAHHPGSVCGTIMPEITLEISEFAPDEPADSVASTVAQVLLTPERYLESYGIHFAIPAGEAGDPAVKGQETIYPNALLSVNGLYSEPARKSRIKGTVVVRVTVGVDGRVHQPQIIRGLGFGLDENALRVFPLWRFEPGRQGDKAVAVRSAVQMKFDLL